jgi:hypothetical protein
MSPKVRHAPIMARLQGPIHCYFVAKGHWELGREEGLVALSPTPLISNKNKNPENIKNVRHD